MTGTRPFPTTRTPPHIAAQPSNSEASVRAISRSRGQEPATRFPGVRGIDSWCAEKLPSSLCPEGPATGGASTGSVGVIWVLEDGVSSGGGYCGQQRDGRLRDDRIATSGDRVA